MLKSQDADVLLDESEFLQKPTGNETIQEIDLTEVCRNFKDNDLVIYSVRCGVHSLQLSVRDTLKYFREFIEHFSYIAKIMRRQSFQKILSKYQLNKPVAENDTRWNTIYYMIESV